MSHDPEVYGYHDYVKTARIATKVRRAMHQQHCSSNFHEDDCAGCNSFLDCAKQQEDFSAECWCPYCYWLGTWDECEVKVIKQTWLDPEERYALCPHCRENVEDVNE